MPWNAGHVVSASCRHSTARPGICGIRTVLTFIIPFFACMDTGNETIFPGTQERAERMCALLEKLDAHAFVVQGLQKIDQIIRQPATTQVIVVPCYDNKVYNMAGHAGRHARRIQTRGRHPNFRGSGQRHL